MNTNLRNFKDQDLLEMLNNLEDEYYREFDKKPFWNKYLRSKYLKDLKSNICKVDSEIIRRYVSGNEFWVHEIGLESIDEE